MALLAASRAAGALAAPLSKRFFFSLIRLMLARPPTAVVSPPSHSHRYHGVLHSQIAIPRRFNHSQALSRQLRLPSTGLARAPDNENMTLLWYKFAMPRDCMLVIPLSCTHEKLHPRIHSSAVASKLDLLRTNPHGSYAACETAKGRWILRCSEVAGS